jgi:UDP-glucose 4-epimerase
MDRRGTAACRTMVWGAFGFIGKHLTRALLRRGMQVTVVSRPGHNVEDAKWPGPVQHVELNIDDYSAGTLRDLVADCAVIYDLAGSSGAVASNLDPVASLEGNCRIQLRLLEACAAAGTRPHVVFSSSRLVYGQTGMSPVAEDHAVNPLSVYAAHKLCTEHYLNIYSRIGHITHTICRISNVYGSDEVRIGQGYRVMNAFIRSGLAKQTITLFGDGRQLRDFIYISDLVEALIRSGTYPAARNELFNIGSGVSSSMYEAACLIRQMTGAPPLRFSPWPKDYELVESGDYVADISKAKALLGLAPVYTLAEGLAESIAMLRRAEEGTPIVERTRQVGAHVSAVGT